MLIFPASIIGLDHRKKLRNNQDALFVAENDTYFVSGVADGMGSGEQSETVASLAIRFLVRQLLYIVSEEKRSAGIPYQYQAISDKLYVAYRLFLEGQIKLQNENMPSDYLLDNETFLDNYMMHTVVLLIVNKGTGDICVFALGDGYLMINPHDETLSSVVDIAELCVLPENSSGTYYSSMLFLDNTSPFVMKQLNKGFIVMSYASSEWNTLLISSDGLRDVITLISEYTPHPEDEEIDSLLPTYIQDLFNLDFLKASLPNSDDLSLIYVINPYSQISNQD